MSFKIFANEKNCNFDKSKFIENLRDPRNILDLNLQVNNYKKWTINSLKILSDINENIRPEHKKRFKATLTVKYKFGICKHKVRIRQHGDWKDHIIYHNNQNSISQSLNVSITDGNILGITEFILFLPATREGANEIFTTHLLQKLNILSPRSYIFDLKFNGEKINMIFQEKINKEFLENFNKKEGPILEGDEELIWTRGVGINHKNFKKYELISLSRLINTNWSAKNMSNFIVSTNALSKLQEVYLKYTNLKTKNNINLALDYETLSNYNLSLYNEWLIYELLLLSLNADHALRPHNRKFYWNIFKNGFEPIYYDGNSKINKICKNEIIDINDLSVDKYDLYIYSNLINETHFKYIEDKLIELKDDDEFYTNISSYSDLSKIQIQNNLDTILNNSKCIKKFFYQQIKNYERIIYDIDSLKKEYYERLNLLSVKYYAIDSRKVKKNSNILKNILNCDDNNICNIKYHENLSELSNLLDHRFKINNKNIFYLDNHKNNSDLIYIEKNIVGLNFRIIHTKDTLVTYDQNNKEITITQNTNTDRVIFLDGKLDDINIVYKGIDSNTFTNDNLIKEKEIYTGCLTFHNIIFNNVNISTFDGKCEDSINFIKSSGSINHIKIKRSFSDALDFDFSKIKVESIYVENAKNDCVDFSYGKYEINELQLNKCGDKAISIGENSTFYNKLSYIKNSNIGIASKDSSLSFFNKVNIENCETCISAYNKKQEFDGSFIEVNNLNCKNYKKNIFLDHLSKINIKNLINGQ